MDYARCSVTKYLNQKLVRVCYYVENAFEICKNRFRILSRPLKYVTKDIIKAIILVAVICIFYNFLIDVRDEMDIIPDPRLKEERFVTRENKDMIEQDVDIINVRM